MKNIKNKIYIYICIKRMKQTKQIYKPNKNEIDKQL